MRSTAVSTKMAGFEPCKSTSRLVFYIQTKDTGGGGPNDLYRAGSLWTKDIDSDSGFVLCLRSSSNSQQLREVSFDNNVPLFRELDADRFNLLWSIPTEDKRLRLYREQSDLLTFALTVRIGLHVGVSILGDDGRPMDASGFARFVGRLEGDEFGRMFGIELDPDFEGKGTSDGMFRKKRYFQCREDGAVFVNASKLLEPRTSSPSSLSSEVQLVADIRYDSGGKQQASSSSSTDPDCPPIVRKLVEKCRLRIGDEVVWMSDDGPEHGTVRWIGVLPDAPAPRGVNDLTVGVEFERPIGSGTGRYRSRALFEARRRHASLVPILGLMTLDDFRGADASYVSFDRRPNAADRASSPSTVTTDDDEQPRASGSVLPVPVAAAATHPGTAVVGAPSTTRASNPALSQSGESPTGESGRGTASTGGLPSAVVDVAATRQSPVVKGRIMTPSVADVEVLCGLNRGIQPCTEKCSLEAVVFALFAFCSDFDDGLFAVDVEGRMNLVGSVRNILAENVVNAVRAASFVSADRMRKFADLFSMIKKSELVDCATANVVLTEDPVETVNSILRDLLRVEPPFHVDADRPCFVFDVDLTATIYPFPTLQHLMERAVLQSPGWRLRSAPASTFVVAIDAPRFGRLVPGGRIFPALTIDVGGLLSSAATATVCKNCGAAADDASTPGGLVQCGDCFTTECNSGITDALQLASYSYCRPCFCRYHSQASRRTHQPFELRPAVGDEAGRSSRLELYGVVSLVGDHYVTFFKAGHGPSAAWLVYDPKARCGRASASRASAVGGGDKSDAVWIPEIKRCSEVETWLSDVHTTRNADSIPEVLLKMILGLRLCFYRPLSKG